MMIYPSKPWSVSDFQLCRPTITNFVDTNIVPLIDYSNNKIRRICVHGQVKVGKREIVEYLARRDYGNDQRKHVFISAFHRISDDPQRTELKNHDIAVYSMINNNEVQKAIEYINKKIENEIEIIIHYDECDYGTGYKQQLAKIYNNFKNNELITSILYSATPEELLYSQDISNEDEVNFGEFISDFCELGVTVKYIPPDTYCGAKKFLDENLVFDAKPFIIENNKRWKLSDQAIKIISDAKENLRKSLRELRELETKLDYAIDVEDHHNILKYKNIIDRYRIKNIIVVRLTYEVNRDKIDRIFQQYYQTFDYLNNVNVIFDKDKSNRVKWSDKKYWDLLDKSKLIIIIHDQTSTRSTEWVFHDKLFATHDYRPNITYNTIVQAELRVAHYSTTYGEFQRIQVYGHKPSFQYTAQQINLESYFEPKFKTVKFSYNNIKVGQILNFLNNSLNNDEDDELINNSSENLQTREQTGEVINFNSKRNQCIVSYGGKHINVSKDRIIIKKNHYIICNSDDTINETFKEIYNQTNVEKIMRDQLGAVKVINLSPRLTGTCKTVLKIFSKFIPCNPTNITEILIQEIKNCSSLSSGILIPLETRNYNFQTSTYFNNSKMINGEEIYEGILRSERKKYKYEELKNSRWGFNKNNTNPRLTVCYDNHDNLGVCLRFINGEMENIENLKAYLSMYKS